MSNSKNLGGFINIPIPGLGTGAYPMTFETYKKKYGIDLRDILTDNPEGGTVPLFKVNKPIYTEDVDRYNDTIPVILPIVTNIGQYDGVDRLQIVHGVESKSGFYMIVDWVNKTLSAEEY